MELELDNEWCQVCLFDDFLLICINLQWYMRLIHMTKKLSFDLIITYYILKFANSLSRNWYFISSLDNSNNRFITYQSVTDRPRAMGGLFYPSDIVWRLSPYFGCHLCTNSELTPHLNLLISILQDQIKQFLIIQNGKRIFVLFLLNSYECIAYTVKIDLLLSSVNDNRSHLLLLHCIDYSLSVLLSWQSKIPKMDL